MAINKLDNIKVEEGVSNLLKVFEEKRKETKNLLGSMERIYLQVDFVKIPRMRKTITRLSLPNSLLTETSDVCLIVADVKRGRNVPHNITINHYNKLLRKKGVLDAQKLSILPSRQIRVEYAPFEARKKLCHMYDTFLIDNKISSFLYPKLGKEFFKCRKWPIPIRMKRKNLKDEILSKLHKTSLTLDGTGTTKTMQIGHAGMTAPEIAENIVSASFYMMKYFPGGWNNIRSLHIKGERTIAVPLYVSLISPNEVPVPKIKGKRRKRVLAVDEVTSIGRKVTVYRSGKIKVHDPTSDDSEDEYETDEDNGSEQEEKPVVKKAKSVESESIVSELVGSESESEEHADADNAETDYLFRIQKEGEEEEERKKREEEKKKKEEENEKKTEQSDSCGKETNKNRPKKNKMKKETVDNHQPKKKKLTTQ